MMSIYTKAIGSEMILGTLARASASVFAIAALVAVAPGGNVYAADGVKNLSTEGKADGSAGYASASVNVDWMSAKKFRVSGFVADICNGAPGDGRGAYLRIEIVMTDRDTGQISRKDVDGCDNGGMNFDVTRTMDLRVQGLNIFLIEGSDADGDGNPENEASRAYATSVNQYF